ncbi:MAG: Omp28-related outer membrane protein [Bacteroidota bacterium]
MKPIFTLVFSLLCLLPSYGQSLFYEGFDDVVISAGAAKVPSDWVVENRDGQEAYDAPRNYPFDQTAYRLDAWAITDINLGDERVAISTSLHGPDDNVTDRWLMSPKVVGIQADSYLFWDGYTDNLEGLDNGEIWVTTSIAGSSPTAADFLTSNANRVHTFKLNPDDFQTYAIDLGAYAGEDIYFAFRNLSFIPARTILDNFEVKAAYSDDVEVSKLTMPTYILSGPGQIRAQITSRSRAPITSLTLSYEVDQSGTIKTETFSVGLDEFGDQVEVVFGEVLQFSEGGHEVRVWVNTVNGNTDVATVDNELLGFVSAINEPPLKRVLIQEYTGSWCGWCPAGTVILEEITAGDPTFVPVALHFGDDMQIDESLEICGIAASGYPSASFDFQRFPGEGNVGVSRTQWFQRALSSLQSVVPVELDVQHTYDRSTRELSVTVNTEFIGAVRDDLRLNVWVIEEEVTGPLDGVGNNGWNNANYSDDDPSSPYYGMGPFLDPSQFKHEHVFNASLTGTWGDPDAFPREIQAGQNYSADYSFTLPTAAGAEQHWKAEDVHVVAFVSHFDVNPRNRYVLNAARGETLLVGTQDLSIPELNALAVQPNPARERAFVSVELSEASRLELSLTDALGRVVYAAAPATYPAGTTTTTLDLAGLPAGLYVLRLQKESGEWNTQKLLLQP